MAIGDVTPVPGAPDVHVVDTGMYGVPEYGAVYLVDAARPAVIDTGIGADYEHVRSALDAVGIDPADLVVIAPTHVHLDHAGGAGRLARDCPNAEVVVHEIGQPHLVDPERLIAGTKRAVGDQWRHYADPVPVPEERTRALVDGDRIDLGDRHLTVHHAPGHAPHQVVFHDAAAGVVFTGDAAGIYVPARDVVRPSTPPPNFDPQQALADIDRLRELDPDVLGFGHYGPVAADDVLRRARDVLEAWVESVEAVRAELGDDEAVLEHFVEEAPFADVWGEEHARSQASLNARGVLVWLSRRED